MIHFTLTGDIESTSCNGLLDFLNSQLINHNYTDTFTIYLSSIGGDIDSAIRVYDFLKSIPNKIHVIGFGQIDSAAITILLAGDKRTVLEHTRFRFHEPTYYMQQADAGLDFFEERIKFFKHIDNRMKEITANETNQSISDIKKIYAEGRLLNTNQAKEMGIVHEIVKELPKPISLT